MAARGAVPIIVDVLRGTGKRGAHPPIVLVDGRSGAGKSSLARLVAAEVPGLSVIRLDDIYPGWDGLDAASTHVFEQVIEPLRVRRPARWQRWDWRADAPAEWHPVDASLPVLIEGIGTMSRANRLHANLGVWVELDAATRKQRALDRDGDSFAQQWERWAAQELAFIEREQPDRVADLTVDGRSIAR